MISAGEDLTYTAIYDDIRQARYEEDSQLSQGVWQHDIVQADWNKVKNLCLQALETKSKDLQIVGWLIEALTMLNGFNGIASGIEVLEKFIDKYWEICYPHTADGKSDQEQKVAILEWIYETIHRRVVLLPIVEFSLYNYEYAYNMKMAIMQNPTQANVLLDSAKNNNIKTIDEINNIIASLNNQNRKNLLNQLNKLSNNIAKLTTLLQNKFNLEPAFPKLSNDVNKICSIFKINNTVSVNNKTVNINLPNQVTKPLVSERNELYATIEALANQLEKLDKHSPSPLLLKLIVSWKDKSLLEVMSDLQQGSTEAHQLLRKLLG